jgi:hypothetical protein
MEHQKLLIRWRRITRARCNVHEALGGAFPKRHHVDCGGSAIICKVPILGCHSSQCNLLYTKSNICMFNRATTLSHIIYINFDN